MPSFTKLKNLFIKEAPLQLFVFSSKRLIPEHISENRKPGPKDEVKLHFSLFEVFLGADLHYLRNVETPADEEVTGLFKLGVPRNEFN